MTVSKAIALLLVGGALLAPAASAGVAGVRDGFDWSAGLIGPAVMLALVVAAAFATRLVRRSGPLRPAAFALLTVGLATAAAVAAIGAKAGQPWGPETPPFNTEVILRDVGGGKGFGHVKFRQPNDDARIIYLDTWVRDLVPNHGYHLQRAVDPVNQVDGRCDSTGWLTLGKGFTLPPHPITTDDRGTGREELWRDLDPPGPMTGPQPGDSIDIHFRVIDAVTSAPVLQSDCYRFTVSL